MKKPTVPPLLVQLLRPRRRTLAAILAAMLVQSAMSLAAPWPLKIVIDTVIGHQREPEWINWVLAMLGGAEHKSHIAVAAGIATVLIAVVTGAALYAVSYFTESLNQSIGYELRVRLYGHLQELSLAYYDTTRVGTLLSTLTSDVQTIQRFLVNGDAQYLHQQSDRCRHGHRDVVVPLGFHVDRVGGNAPPWDLRPEGQQSDQDRREGSSQTSV